jgi:hypothetical protein
MPLNSGEITVADYNDTADDAEAAIALANMTNSAVINLRDATTHVSGVLDTQALLDAANAAIAASADLTNAARVARRTFADTTLATALDNAASNTAIASTQLTNAAKTIRKANLHHAATALNKAATDLVTAHETVRARASRRANEIIANAIGNTAQATGVLAGALTIAVEWNEE